MQSEITFKELLSRRAYWLILWLIPLIGGLYCLQNIDDISIRELGWILIAVSFLPFFFGVSKPRKILTVTSQGIYFGYSFLRKPKFLSWGEIEKLDIHKQFRPHGGGPGGATLSQFIYYLAIFLRNSDSKVDRYIPVWKCLPDRASESEAMQLLSTILAFRDTGTQA